MSEDQKAALFFIFLCAILAGSLGIILWRIDISPETPRTIHASCVNMPGGDECRISF